MNKLEEYGFAKEESRQNILANKHDHITTTYYLLLKKMIREGKESVADLVSKEFHEFINNTMNLLEYANKKMNASPVKKYKDEKEKTLDCPLKERIEEEGTINIPAPNNQLKESLNKSNYFVEFNRISGK